MRTKKTKLDYRKYRAHNNNKKNLRNIKNTIDFYKQFNSMTSKWCPANCVLITKGLYSGNFYNRKIYILPLHF